MATVKQAATVERARPTSVTRASVKQPSMKEWPAAPATVPTALAVRMTTP